MDNVDNLAKMGDLSGMVHGLRGSVGSAGMASGVGAGDQDAIFNGGGGLSSGVWWRGEYDGQIQAPPNCFSLFGGQGDGAEDLRCCFAVGGNYVG